MQPTIDHGTSTTTKSPIQPVSIQPKLGAPKTGKAMVLNQRFKVSLLFFPSSSSYIRFIKYFTATTIADPKPRVW